MTDRTVVTRLRLEYAQFAAGLDTMANKARVLATETGAAAAKNAKHMQTISRGAAVAGAGIGAAFLFAEKPIMSFGKQMSGVAAVSDATSKQMKRLESAAIAAGANTKLAGVSASEAAESEAELVKAGVAVNDVLGGALVGSLQLASAGQLDFADAATIAAQAMNIWKLGGTGVTHIADVLAAAANKSAANVDDLGLAIQQGGLVAKGANQSLEETVGTLALFADNALRGSDAGTALKTFLLQLEGPSGKAADKMEELGLSAYDAQGHFVGMEELAGRLQATMGGLSEESRNSALSLIFGNDAARAAGLLYTAGADGVHKYVSEVNDQGAAARMAAKQMNNLSGDIENLGGALEAAILKNGSQATGVLRLGAQGATAMVNQFGELPAPLAATGGGLVAVTGAGLGMLGMLGIVVPKIAEGQKELLKLGRAGQMANTGLGWAAKGSVLAVGVLALAEAIQALDAAASKLFDGTPNIEATTGALLDLAEGNMTLEAALKVGRTSIAELDQQIRTFGKGSLNHNLDDIDKALSAMVQSGSPKAAVGIIRDLAAALDMTPKELTKYLDDYRKASGSAGVSSKAAAAAAKESGDAHADAAGGVDEATDALDAYSKILDEIYGSTFDVQSATNAYRSDLTEFADGVRAAQIEGDKFATSLDDTTVSGARNQEALAGIVRKALDVADAMKRQGATTSEISDRMDGYRGMLSSVLQQLGFNAQAAEIYTDALLQVPSAITTTAELKTDAAKAKLAELFGLLGGYMREARDFDHAMKFGTPIPTINTSPVAVNLGQGLSDAVAGRGQQARSAADAKSKSAGQSAKDAAEEAKRRQEALTAFLEADFKRRMAITENMYEAGVISADKYMKSLDEQQAREVKYSDEWEAIQKKKEAVFTDAADKIAEAQKKQAEAAEAAAKKEGDAAKALSKIRDDALSRLNELIDQEQGLRAQLADSAAQHRKKMADIESGRTADMAAAFNERKQALLGWARLDEQVSVTWGNTMSAVSANVQDQLDQFTEWATTLDALRGRGLSTEVISMLGLDAGPQALGQLRAFSSATDAEIAQLNNLVSARVQQASSRVSAEQADTYSKISATLKGITERYAAEVEAEAEAFLAEQADLNAKLAALGEVGGRSWAEAIAKGIASGLPALIAAANQVAAIQRAIAAGPSPSTGGNTYVDPTIHRDPGQTGPVVDVIIGPDGQFILVPRGTVPSHAAGTPYVDQTGLANIHQGERILSAVDNVKLVAAVQSMAGGSSQPIAPNVHFVATLEIDGQQIPVNVKAVEMLADGQMDARGQMRAIQGSR